MTKYFSKLEQEFIKDLAHEMKTQDTRCTAQPYGLVISTEHIQYGFESGHTEFIGYYDREDCENYYHEEDFSQFIEDITPMLSEEDHEELTEKIEKFAIKSFHYLDLFCSDIIPSRYEVQGYKKVRTADSTDGCYEGNFFLTEKAANNYIKRNKHNLSNPETYGIHLYRNPEMENLYNIIHKLAKAIEEEANN